MTNRAQFVGRQQVMRKMAAMRAAKERKRQERIAAGGTPEPRMERWYPMELGLRDKATGETAWVDFRSLRDALCRLAVVRRFYVPGLRSKP
jgi:hypothetical protein